MNDICYRPDRIPSDGSPDVMVDAEIDGNPALDTDMDGIFDDVDNCRMKSNPGQYDEDKDNVGDVCDPCPISTTNADDDMDGVGNACDPNPNTGGDVIALFEGFNGPLPAGWVMSGNGTWSVANGVVAVTVGAGATASLTAPIAPDMNATIVTSATAMTILQNPIAGLGVALPIGQNGFAGIVCSIYDDGSRRFGLYNIETDTVFESTSKDWTIGTAYRFGLQRVGDEFRCLVDGELQQDAQAPNPLVPRIGVRTLGINASFAYLLYVNSPN